jgi:DNA-binding NtrC family response regulator
MGAEGESMLKFTGRVAVIEDDVSLCEAVARIVESWGARVVVATTAMDAKALLAAAPPPELILIDVRLSDDSAFGVLEVATQLSPAPVIVAMSGKASPDEAFRLAQLGVRRYLHKPFSVQDLTSAVESACSTAPNIEPLISAWVGRVPMREMQQEVRRVMVKEALALTDGNRSGAARLLHVTRQAVQQMVRSDGDTHLATSSPKASGH